MASTNLCRDVTPSTEQLTPEDLEWLSQRLGLSTDVDGLDEIVARCAADIESESACPPLAGALTEDDLNRTLAGFAARARLHMAPPLGTCPPSPPAPVLLPASLADIDLTPESRAAWIAHCAVNQAESSTSQSETALASFLDALSPEVGAFLRSAKVVSVPYIDETHAAVLALFSGPRQQTVVVADRVETPASELAFLFHHLYCHFIDGHLRRDVCDARLEYQPGHAPSSLTQSAAYLEEESATDGHAARLMAPDLACRHLCGADAQSVSASSVTGRQLWLRDVSRHSRALIDQLRDGLRWSYEFRGAAAVVRGRGDRHVFLTLAGTCATCGEIVHLKRWIPSTDVLSDLNLSALDIAEIPDARLAEFESGAVLLAPMEIAAARGVLANSMRPRWPYVKLFAHATVNWDRPLSRAADQLSATLIKSDPPASPSDFVFGTCNSSMQAHVML